MSSRSQIAKAEDPHLNWKKNKNKKKAYENVFCYVKEIFFFFFFICISSVKTLRKNAGDKR